MIRQRLLLLILIPAASCGVFEAIETLIVGSQEAVEATKDAAEQAEKTLAALEHLLLIGGAYLLGELRRPLWKKVRDGVNNRKTRRANRKV